MGFEEWYGNPVGLVLNGGGGKGAYQIGAFRAIREAGLDKLVTAVAGTSVGALNMCLFNYDDGVVGEDIWTHISPEYFIVPDVRLIDGREGIVNREGLTDIMDNYLDFDKISNNPLKLYATVTEFDGEEEGVSKAVYMQLNGRSTEDIKSILLASSALPFIYEPVIMNGITYKDGGLKDNLPVKPLYDIGIRKFIVIMLSDNVPDMGRFPDAEFLIIRPYKDLGNTITGTLDFTKEGAKERMKLGYMDAVRAIKYYNDPDVDIDRIAAIELKQFENTMRTEKFIAGYPTDNLNKLKDIYSKYDTVK